ncbi:glycerophosphodiester phosphodiesterase family protein [Ancylomarina salipaludis]|uniref:Glycerophosphodiester phosphodiesterase family protein n=1 Tax=Ancylomarina salipaludis TaxID=2501299 RepID=A0A4Q1JQA2_9BACT|nr:glycerophosphodiester phosphodiesterase family protein [Ancylomarina salipaludis]RXQ97378.1 glycerophosphodiester phosphodiesterase family protein [Ancylomarina salipaludis]
MKTHLLILLIIFQHTFSTGSNIQKKINSAENHETRVDSLLKIIHSNNDEYVLVAAHRANWTQAPENTIQAIKDAMAVGVDIIEIDVRMTKDNRFVLIHDKTLERTTTGTGKVSHWTLDSLKTLFITDRTGKATSNKIPTLEEALILTKGKVLLNLDKCTKHLKEITKLLIKTQTLNQVIIKTKTDFWRTQLHKKCSKNKLIYIPKIDNHKKNLDYRVEKFIKKHEPIAFDIRLSPADSLLLPLINKMKKKSCRIWVSTTPNENINYRGETKNHIDQKKKWDWALDLGANIIITDEPNSLIDYLNYKGLRKKTCHEIPDKNKGNFKVVSRQNK